MTGVRAGSAQGSDARIARRRVTTGVLGMEAGPQRSTRRRQRMLRRRGHHSPTRTRYSKVRSPMQQRQMSALALSPIKREIADSVARANRPEGNCQCRRWYDLFAATPEALSVVPVYCTRRHSISSPDQMKVPLAEFHARPHGTGAVQRRRQRNVKPPENSRAFTASRKWPPSRRIQRPVLRRRSPVSSGVK
jgi:hypothetical protein